MTEKTISEQIIDKFMRSMQSSYLINDSILKELRKICDTNKPTDKKGLIPLLEHEE